MKSGKRSYRRKFLDKLFGHLPDGPDRQPASRRLRRFEALESRWMLHGDELHGEEEGEGVNGPHESDPTYDLSSFHIHPNVSIYVNGKQVGLPAFGGVSGGDSIHKHDTSAAIHIHPSAPRTTYVTLGEVFDAWKAAPQSGNPNAILNASNLLNNVEDSTHTISMFVNGVKTESYDDYQVHDGDDIVLTYSSNPIVTVNTNLGRVPVELFADKTPITVNNFLNYVNDGDYTNVFFHRLVPNFVLQGGGFKTNTMSFADPTVANNFTTVGADAQIQNEFDNFAKVSGTGATVTLGNAVINLGTTADLSNVVVGDRIRLVGRTDGLSGTNMFDITAVNDAANTVTVQAAPTAATTSNVNWTVFPKVNVTGTLAMAKLGGNPNSATNQFFINLVNNDSNLDLQNGGFTVFGQILDQSILTDIAGLNDLSLFNATLNGAQEVPPVTTSATGSATLALNNKNPSLFDLTVNMQGLTSGSVTASHIHTGAVGVDGPNVFDLGDGSQYTANGSQLQRKIDNATFPATSLTSLFQSQTYVNVHTTANPDGEIRGQLTPIQGGLYSDLPTTSTDQLVVIQSITGEGVVRGTIYNDADNDGVKDTGESGRQGFTVFDDANNNGGFDSTETSATSDVNGNYALRLASGQHKIRLVPTNGFAKSQPADAYDVTVQIGRDILARDFGVLQVPGLTGLDLLAATDSGVNSSDNLTNFNNSTSAKALQFAVTGAVDGALVRILSDGVVIGQANVPVGSNGNLTITTNGTTTLTDGVRGIIATQEIRGVQSTPTTNLGVNIDSQVQPFTSTPPTTANAGTAINYNVETPEEGQANFVYSLVSPPTGAVINGNTGTVAWTPSDAQTGVQEFQVSATDAAGNVLTQSLSITVSKISQVRFNLQTTDVNGVPITHIDVGGTFQLRATLEDIRTTGTRTGVFSGYEDVAFDGNLATATAILHSSIYGQGVAGTIATGLIDEVGSFAPSIVPLGPNPQLLYTITLTANRSGNLTFTGNKPDILPQHDIGLYGIDARVPPDEVSYGTASISILNPNFQANDDVFNFDEDTSNNPLNVLINDHGRPGSTLTIVNTGTTSKGGTVSIINGGQSLSYTPPANFFGEDNFTYIVSDGSDQAVGTVAVQVVDVNDSPQAIGETLSGVDAVPEDSTNNTLDILKNERATANVDQGAPNEILRISAVGPTSNGGTVVIGSQGGFVTYTPAPNFSGTETFTYTITDRSGSNGKTAVATATATVTPQNDSPVAAPDTVSANEDSSNNVFDVLANDTLGSDSGEALTITSVGTGSRGGVITIVENGSKVSYTPAGDVFGEETFVYTISDGNGGSSNATVKVNLAAANDTPDAANDTLNVAKNSTNNTVDVLLNDLSAPDGPETFVITAVTQGDHGGVVEIIDSGAKIRYRPANNYLGPEIFTYTMRDPGGLTDSATVNVTVRDFQPSSLAGFVYIDADNDGVKDTGEQPVTSTKITLTGTDTFGGPVTVEVNTDSTGAYKFENLSPGTYKIKETQPTGQINNLPIVDGKDTIGSQGGTASANDEFSITLTENSTGTGNNFGEITGFKVTGSLMAEEFSGDDGADLAFSNVQVSLFEVDSQNQPIGIAIKTANLDARGAFLFDGVAAGTYSLKSESLSFLRSANSQQLVNVTSADSLSNVLVQGSRLPQYISYRDFLNSTPRTGIFAAVSPGTNGQQWSALDNQWTGFSAVQVGLNSSGNQVRIDLTRNTGEQLFDEIPTTDHRVVVLAQEGNLKLLRLAGGSSNYNLRPVNTTSGGEGEGSRAASAFSTLQSSSESASVTTSLRTAPIVVQPGTLDTDSSGIGSSTVSSSGDSSSSTSAEHELMYVVDTSHAGLSSDGSTDLNSSADNSELAQAIDAVMAEAEDHLTSDDDSFLDDLAFDHHEDESLFDALDAVHAEQELIASS